MTIKDPCLNAIIDHFCPPKGQGDGVTPDPVSKSGGNPRIIFNTTANLKPQTPQLLVWDVYIKDLDRKNVKACEPDLVVNECGCKRWLVPSACMCKDCTSCAPYVQNRTARSLFRRFMTGNQTSISQVKMKPVLYTVLTIPPHIREGYRDPKELKKVRRLAWEMLKTKFGAYYGVESTHPIGDKSLLFHPHLNFVWRQRNGFTPFIDVSMLRTYWADILDVRVVDVWHQYSVNSAQVFKWCEYVGRPFPGYSWWRGSIRWYGRYPKVCVKREWICPDCGCYIRRLGIISGKVVEDYYKHGWLIGLDPPWYNNKNLTLCRGRKKHGTDTGLSEGSLLRSAGACVPAEEGFEGDRRDCQLIFG